jgi:hypothetical protein
MVMVANHRDEKRQHLDCGSLRCELIWQAKQQSQIGARFLPDKVAM